MRRKQQSLKLMPLALLWAERTAAKLAERDAAAAAAAAELTFCSEIPDILGAEAPTKNLRSES